MKSVFVVAIIALLALSVSARPFMSKFHHLKTGKNVRDGNVTFTPAKLPCAYSLLANVQMYQDGHMTENLNETLVRDGDLFAVFQYSAEYTVDQSVRYDLAYQKGGKTYVPLYYGVKMDQVTCQVEDMDKDTIDEEIEKSLSLFTETQVYDSVSKASFKGKKCNMYVAKKPKFELQMYADDDNYIIGMVERDNDGTTIIGAVDYKFDISMSSFAIDRSAFPGCDDKAYEAPQDQC